MESNEHGRPRDNYDNDDNDDNDKEWLAFPGGELEGKRPKAHCALCRGRRGPLGTGESRGGPICFQCYRAALDRERVITSAGQLDTASEARFQSLLPFEPVNRQRLVMLRAERGVARSAMQSGDDRFGERRHQAQIAARTALGLMKQGLGAHRRVMVPPAKMATPERALSERARLFLAAIRAAELQWPESWLPFVVAQ